MASAIYNGKLIAFEDANISIADKGYFFDYAVYSSMKVVQGKLFFPKFHAERLLESAEILGIECKYTVSQIIEWLELLVKTDKLENSFIRLVLIGDPDEVEPTKLYIFAVGSLTFYPDKFYSRGVKVITYEGERRLPKAKSKDLLLSALAFKQAKSQNALEALLIDSKGNIREGTRTNFYTIRGKQLITPPADQVLDGIAQKLVLEVAKDEFEIVREEIPLAEIDTYEEFFMSNTSMNVMPINQIDNKVIGTSFPKTKQIQKHFKDYYRKHILDS